jgi:dephospho-CoA kinase
VDKLGYEALELQKEKIVAEFGRDILAVDGTVDRSALGREVFSSHRDRRRLESIVHPTMVARVKSLLEGSYSGTDVVVNAAVLFPMGLDRLCTAVIWIYAPFLLRLKRALGRDTLGVIEILKRMSSQRSLLPKSRTGDVDIYFIKNNGTTTALKGKLERFFKERGLN